LRSGPGWASPANGAGQKKTLGWAPVEDQGPRTKKTLGRAPVEGWSGRSNESVRIKGACWAWEREEPEERRQPPQPVGPKPALRRPEWPGHPSWDTTQPDPLRPATISRVRRPAPWASSWTVRCLGPWAGSWRGHPHSRPGRRAWSSRGHPHNRPGRRAWFWRGHPHSRPERRAWFWRGHPHSRPGRRAWSSRAQRLGPWAGSSRAQRLGPWASAWRGLAPLPRRRRKGSTQPPPSNASKSLMSSP